MFIKSLLVLMMIVMVLANSVLADTVVLRSGERYDGILANRDQVRTHPTQQAWVSLLVQESGELRRVAIGEIDYIILEDDGKQQVIDFNALGFRPASGSTRRQISQRGSTTNGIALVVFGIGVGAAGALVKLGEPKATVTEHSIDVEEHSYSAANYGMMAVGAVLVVVGVAIASGGARGVALSDKRDGLFVRCWPDQDMSNLLVGYSVVF